MSIHGQLDGFFVHTYTTKKGRTIEVIIRYATGQSPPVPILEATAMIKVLDLIAKKSNGTGRVLAHKERARLL